MLLKLSQNQENFSQRENCLKLVKQPLDARNRFADRRITINESRGEQIGNFEDSDKVSDNRIAQNSWITVIG